MLESCDIGECDACCNEIKLEIFYICLQDFSVSFSQLPSYEAFVNLLVNIGDNHIHNHHFFTSGEIINI